jgi:hypothetical protein
MAVNAYAWGAPWLYGSYHRRLLQAAFALYYALDPVNRRPGRARSATAGPRERQGS